MADPRDEEAPRDEHGPDRTPPHDVLAEQSVLGSMMLSREAIDDVTAQVRGGDFYLPRHDVTFAAITSLNGRGDPVDVITVTDELVKSGQLSRAGGAEYLHTLTGIPTTTANAGYQAQIVAEKAVLRRLVEAGTRIVQMGYASEGEPATLVENARAQVDQVSGVRRQPLQMIGDDILDLVDELSNPPVYLASPWPTLDELIGGFAPGELCVIAARPGDGKSVLLLQAGLKAAKKGVVAMYSLEMSRKELQSRMVSQVGEIHMTSLRNHQLSEQDWNRFGDARKLTARAPLFVEDRGAAELATVSTIRSFVRSVQKRGAPVGSPLAAVVVDYLQLVDGPGSNREQEVAGVARGLKQLAREFDVPVIVAAQLNRGQPGRGGTRPEPTMRDLRESGGIEANADAVLLVHREEKRPRDVDVIVAKNRHGRQGKVTLRWQGEYARVTDRDWRDKLWDDGTEAMQ